MTRVLGIDSSLESTGLAAHDGDEHTTTASTWTVTTVAKAHATWDQRMARIGRVVDRVLCPADAPLPTLAVIEAPAYSRNTGSMFDRAGLWWQLYRALRDAGVPVAVCYPNTRARYATGTGKAKKPEVVAAMARRYPDLMVRTDDEWDALVMAEMGAHWLGLPLAHAMTRYQREALAAVTWPAVGAPR